MYPEIMVIPMREELTARRHSGDTHGSRKWTQPWRNRETTMVVVNSICGMCCRQDAALACGWRCKIQ